MIAETVGSHDSDDSSKQNSSPPPDSQAANMASVFQRVLEETIGKRDDQASTALREAMLAVARSHQGECLELDPIVIELVTATIAPELRQALNGSAIWDEMVACISKSVFTDPQARERLNTLWAQLQEPGRE
jgi:hypothetical protein